MDKSTRWSFTAYEAQWNLFTVMPPQVAEWGWQEEVCPTTDKRHYQGYLRTTTQLRHSQLRKILPGVHIEVAQNWLALQAYCKKADTAVPGTQVTQQSSYMNKFQFLEYLIRKSIQLFGYQKLMEVDKDTAIKLVMLLAREEVMEHTYVAWIISDPNFKVTLKENIRALLVGLKER
jgi:hypothetical protein